MEAVQLGPHGQHGTVKGSGTVVEQAVQPIALAPCGVLKDCVSCTLDLMDSLAL